MSGSTHQYISSSFCHEGISANINTKFPLDGAVTVKASGVKYIAVRIPYYCKKLISDTPYTVKSGYAYFDIQDIDEISFALNLSARFVYSNTSVYDNIGKAAVMYGPVVYCAETADNESVENFFADTSLGIKITGEKFGLPEIVLSGLRQIISDELYSENKPLQFPGTLKMIPYFAFANRGEHEMIAFIPVKN